MIDCINIIMTKLSAQLCDQMQNSTQTKIQLQPNAMICFLYVVYSFWNVCFSRAFIIHDRH